MTSFKTNLLRRTLVLLGTVAGLGVAAEAQAQTVTLTNASSNTCTWTSMSVSPTGSISITCQGGTTPPPPPAEATFEIQAPTNLPINDYSLSVKVKRLTGTSGKNYNVNYSATGSGCSAGDNPSRDLPLWVDGQQWDVPIVTNGTNGGTCVVTLTLPSNTSASPNSRTITVGSSGGGNPPPGGNIPIVAGCPAPAGNGLMRTLGLNDRPDELRMTSGQIAVYQVVASPNPAQSVMIEFTQGQQPNLPSGTTKTDFTVSRCPGVIETNLASQCSYSSTFANNNKIGIFTEVIPGRPTQNDYITGCLAPISQQNYYVNVRWTYPNCPWSTGCGFSMQWASTGSNGF